VAGGASGVCAGVDDGVCVGVCARATTKNEKNRASRKDEASGMPIRRAKIFVMQFTIAILNPRSTYTPKSIVTHLPEGVASNA